MAIERGAARQVHDATELAAAVALYLEQPDLRRAAGAAAQTLLTDNRGALARTLEHMEQTLRVDRGGECEPAIRGLARGRRETSA